MFGHRPGPLIHRDLLHSPPLAAAINKYGFFSYAVYEALHLSEQEEQYIADIFAKIDRKRPPTVEYLANRLNLSSHYLSDMLGSLTGQSAQQHIHQKMIEKAKEYLSTNNLSVAEIAYRLGFDYPQSFKKNLSKTAEQHYREFRRHYTGLEQRISQKQIANYLGISRIEAMRFG